MRLESEVLPTGAPARWVSASWSRERGTLIAFVALVPVVVVPTLGSMSLRFQPADLAFVVAATLLAARLIRERRAPTLGGLGIVLAGFLVVGGTAAALSAEPGRSSTFWLGALYLAVVAVVVGTAGRRPADLRVILDAWLITTGAVATLGIAGTLTGILFGVQSPFVRLAREHAVFGSAWQLIATFQSPPIPNLAYTYLQVGVFLGLGALTAEEDRRRRIWIGAVVGLGVVAIALTQSRGVAALLFGIAAFLGCRTNGVARGLRWASLGVGLALFAAAQLFTYVQVDSMTVRHGESAKRVEEQLKPGRPWYTAGPLVFIQPGTPYREIALSLRYVPEHRLFLRQAELAMGREHPWLGVGPGRFPEELGAFWRAGKLSPEYRLFSPRLPHSTYFGALAEQGLLGLAATLVLLGAVLRVAASARRAPDRFKAGLGWGAYGCLVAFLVYAMDADIMRFRWFWCLIGFVVAIASHGPELEPTP